MRPLNGQGGFTSDAAPHHTARYFWEEGICCPAGYPSYVLSGTFLLADGSYCSLAPGFCSGPDDWGARGSGMFAGHRSLPTAVRLTWLSCAEDKYYHLDCKLDKEAIFSLFRAGFQNTSFAGRPVMDTFNMISLGLAPGGLVVIWLSGAGRQVEVKHYQAQPCRIDIPDHSVLDCAQRLAFSRDRLRQILSDPAMLPHRAQDNIPFHRWHDYRMRYRWMPDFVFPKPVIPQLLSVSYFNGEQMEWSQGHWPTRHELMPLPKLIFYSWTGPGRTKTTARIIFDDTALSQLSGQQGISVEPFLLQLRINLGETAGSVAVVQNETKKYMRPVRFSIQSLT